MSKKTISVIIVTYNSSHYIYDCIDALNKYNDIGDGLEIIIVDNNSQEQVSMFEGIKSKYGDDIILINSGKNGGYGYGNNIGINKASSDIVIVMNPDIRLICPVFNKILEHFREDKNAILGVSFVDGSSPFYFKREYATVKNYLLFKRFIKRGKYDSKRMFMSGSFLAFKKDVFLQAGSFDENIFMYSEEADITNRILLTGKEAVWCPEIQVLHLPHSHKYNEFLDNVRLQSGLYYEKKYGIDSHRVYLTSLRILRIKKLLAAITLNKNKYQMFNKQMNGLKTFAQNNNIA